MSNVKVHTHECACPVVPVYTPDDTFLQELAYAEAEVIAAINAERVMAEVIGR